MVSFVITLLCLVLLTAGLLAAPFSIRKAWRNEVPTFRSTPTWWAYGASAWRGYVRGLPAVSLIGGLGLVVAGWSFMLLTSIRGHEFVPNPSARTALETAVVVGAIGAVVGVGLGGSIWLFNRPRMLVAPHLRHEHGAISDWLAGKRK